jgi:peroxiredoxin
MKVLRKLTSSLLILSFIALPLWAQDATPGKLDEAALETKFKEIVAGLRAGFKAGKRSLADHTKSLESAKDAVANAADPKGAGATKLMFVQAEVQIACKAEAAGIKSLDAVIDLHKTGPQAQRAVNMKLRAFMGSKNLEGVKSLQAQAKTVGLPAAAQKKIGDLYYLVWAQKLSAEGKADEIKAVIAKAEEAKVDAKVLQACKAEIMKASMAVGKAFPDFKVNDTEGKELTLSSFKGKVVLIDFWATWCGPCMQEMPNVIAAYKKYHDKGFDIIGISFDKDEAKFKGVIKAKGMVWRQYFDGKGWGNLLGKKYGIRSIPATFLIGPDGKILGKNLRGSALEEAVAKALKKD